MLLTFLTVMVCLLLIYWKHRGGLTVLPEHLKWQIHKDYTFVLQLIPRTLTSYNMADPPRILLSHNVNDYWWLNGKQAAHPIQRILKGKFCSCHLSWPLYFSISFKWGWYFMIGFRPDAVDLYYTFPAIDISMIERFEP